MTDPNPFAVHTPEGLPAKTMVELFVDVFSDFYNVPVPGHTFLHGPRGSGKSMMFRYMEPDCQLLALKQPLSKLDYLGAFVPIKSSNLQIAELQRLNNLHAENVINEHLLTLYAATRLVKGIEKGISESQDKTIAEALGASYRQQIRALFLACGWDNVPSLELESANTKTILETLTNLLTSAGNSLIRYLRGLAFVSNPVPYNGPLCGYLDFLMPLAQAIHELPFMPKGPIFLLIDDADNLSKSHTEILNSWVACRTTSIISLKISTQLNYKTYLTPNGQPIRPPHDFSEVSITEVYTSRSSHYAQRVSAIVKRRLEAAGITRTPEEFFPEYEKQEQEIRRIGEEIKDKWPTEGRGFRDRDDVNRYARPTYMARLSGKKKGGSKYRYAGFQQLVDLSSGVIRYFLEAATSMYGEALALPRAGTIEYISTEIQDKVVRNQAERFLFDEVQPGESDSNANDDIGDLEKLRNLITALGGAFHELLLSDASERRVFSVALSDAPTRELREILKRGVEYGFFHESTIGNKEGTGRTRLYIMSRRLAPFFKLDPSNFAGYKFVTSAKLSEAMYHPISFVRRIKTHGTSQAFDDLQAKLFNRQE